MNLKTNILPSKFFMMIILSITAACVLVVISMALYSYSGAAQLDLSRPDYQTVRKHAQKTDTFEGFDTSSQLNDDSIKEFDKMFNKKLKIISDYKNSFDSASLGNESLGILAE